MYARPGFHQFLGMCLVGFGAVGCLDSGPDADPQAGEESLGGSSSSPTTGGTSAPSQASSSVAPNSSAGVNSSTAATSAVATGATGGSHSTSHSTTQDTSGSAVSTSDETTTATGSASTSDSESADASSPDSSSPDSSSPDSSSDSSNTGSATETSSGVDSVTVEQCPAEPQLTGGQEYCSNSKGNAGNGYGYELWAEGSGTGCMTVFGSGAAFKTEWNDVEDFLARVGLDFDETRTHQQVGEIWAEFAETQTGSEEGLTYIGIYGWTVDPLREFYILDDWGTTKPAGVASDGTPRDEMGTLVIDGETYDVWKKTRENKPSIKGTATFDQYFSIRRTARQCGRISVTEHFSGWEDLGMPLGNLYEVKILVESQFNSGSVEFTSAAVRTQ